MKRLIYILFFFAVILPLASFAQVINQLFPSLEAETVEDKIVTLPQDTKGRITLVGMAYSQKSENDLSTWMSPIFNTFIRQKMNDGGLFADFTYDIDVYFIPMFTGVKAAAKGVAKRKAVKHLDNRLWPYVLLYKGKLKPYKDALDFGKRDAPYFFLLDKNGKIVYATSGGYSDKKMDEIEEIIDTL